MTPTHARFTPRNSAPAAPAVPATGSRLFVFGLLCSAVAVVFTCMCGYIQPQALPLSVAGAALTWYPFLRYNRTNAFISLAVLLVVLISTLVLAKNLADVLWFGHQPLFH